jgi:hypothetical protein
MLALDLDNCAHLPKVGWVDSSSTRSTHTPERTRGVCPHVVDHVVRRRFQFHLVRVVTLRVVLLLVFRLLLLVSSLPSLASLPGSANCFLIGSEALSSVAASPSQGPNNKWRSSAARHLGLKNCHSAATPSAILRSPNACMAAGQAPSNMHCDHNHACGLDDQSELQI